jgi:hypothetical protein
MAIHLLASYGTLRGNRKRQPWLCRGGGADGINYFRKIWCEIFSPIYNHKPGGTREDMFEVPRG